MQSRTNSLQDPEKGLSRPTTNTRLQSTQLGSTRENTSVEDFGIAGNGVPVNGREIGSSNESPTSETLMRRESPTENIHPSMKDRAKNLIHRGGKSEKDTNAAEEQPNDDVQPGSKKKKFANKKYTLKGQLRATIFGSWINILLICVPVGIALNYTNVNGVAIFVVNFMAIIPLAGMLSYSTEEISMRVGETLGGLMNASFG